MSGYRVYITAKDNELLGDILFNDVSFSEDDDQIEDKNRLINKLLDLEDQERINRCK
jgi:hypothetical protein